MVENPDRAEQVTQSKSQAVSSEPVSVEGKCLGFQYNYCRNLLLVNGTVIPNPNFVDTFDPDSAGPYAGSTDQTPQPAPAQAPQPQVQTQVVDDDNSNSDNSREENESESGEDNGGGLECEDVNPDDECDPGDPEVEREKELAEAGGEEIDGEWFDYDPDTYWDTEEH